MNFLIEKLKEKNELSYEELERLFKGYLENKVTDEEMTKVLKTICKYGLSENEVFSLVDIFIKSGDVLEENPDLEFEDLIYLPAREIAKYISEYDSVTGGNGSGQGQGNGNNQAQNQSSNKGQGQGNGNGNGQGQGSGNGNGDRLRKQDGTGNNCNGINCQNQN